MTIKQVRLVKAVSRDPVQDIAELAVFNSSGKPVDLSATLADGSVTTVKLANNAVTATKIASGVLPTNATKEKAGLVKQAEHINDPTGETPTKSEFIKLRDALVKAGLMASS